MRELLLASVLMIAPVLPTVTLAKDCDCDQHNAAASGAGSCSLTESSSYCQINYTGSLSNERAARNNFNDQDMQELSFNYFRSQILLEETFRFLNERGFQSITEDEFRAILINTIILSSPPESDARSLLDALDLDNLRFGAPSQIQDLYSMFSRYGCAEASIDTSEGQVRYLLIHARSELNGSCAR